jgi:hypothetical protein
MSCGELMLDPDPDAHIVAHVDRSFKRIMPLFSHHSPNGSDPSLANLIRRRSRPSACTRRRETLTARHDPPPQPTPSTHESSALASPRRGTLAPNTCILRCSGPAKFSFAARPPAVRRAGSEHTRHCEPKRYAHQTVQRAASPASAVPVGRGTCSRAAAAQFDVFTSWSDPPRLSFTSGQPFIRPATVIPHWPPSCTPTQAYESDPEPHPEAA